MPDHKHQLAAIMFTDIVGYTTLMGRNEKTTLTLLKINREIHKKWIRIYKGKLIKEIGDGILASFLSTSNAVHCAGAILKDLEEIENLDLRIGIHLGEITTDDKEIYGDGINIASRIEGFAANGQLLISESVYKTIKNKDEFQCTFLDEQLLKNVDEPVRIYIVEVLKKNEIDNVGWLKSIKKNFLKSNKMQMILAGLLVVLIILFIAYKDLWDTSDHSNSNASETKMLNSIAVLPFEDMSPNGDQEYLGDGIAEEIINVLTKINGLKVIGRTSSFSFKDQTVDLKTIGEKLGVKTILEGSVRKYDDQIRITAQLINSEDGTHFWSETYNRDLENIFAIQDEISSKIADKFKLTQNLSLEKSPPTKNLEAYELFLRARVSYGRGMVGTETAMNYLEEAIKLDHSFFRAYILISDVYFSMGIYGLADPSLVYNKAISAAFRAIEIDPNSYLGYYKLSWLYYFVDWDRDKALENYHKAQERGLPDAEDTDSFLFTDDNIDLELLIQRAKRKLESDPLSGKLCGDLTRLYLWANRYDVVIKTGNKFLNNDIENSSVKRHMGWSYFFKNEIDKANELFVELIKKDSTYVPGGYIATLMRLGKYDESWKYFNSIKHKLSSYKKAESYIHLNQLDSAFKYFDSAYREKDVLMLFLNLEPQFKLISDDPRYAVLLKKMNLPVD